MDKGSIGWPCVAIVVKPEVVPEYAMSRGNAFDSFAIDQVPDDFIGSLRAVGDTIDGVLGLQCETATQPVTSTV